MADTLTADGRPAIAQLLHPEDDPPLGIYTRVPFFTSPMSVVGGQGHGPL